MKTLISDGLIGVIKVLDQGLAGMVRDRIDVRLIVNDGM